MIKSTFIFKALCVVSFIMILLACNKKFDHDSYSATAIPQDCPLCNYADSLSGNYKCLTFPGTSNTVYYALRHVYLGLGSKIDSTTMFFDLYETDSTGTSETWKTTVSISKNDGVFYSAQPGYTLIASNDSLFGVYSFFDIGGNIVYTGFKGVKMP